jgi:hypothetical protein
MFRFTIRDVLWLTVVLALAMAWWVHGQQMHRAYMRSEEQRRIAEIDYDMFQAAAKAEGYHLIYVHGGPVLSRFELPEPEPKPPPPTPVDP